jgi:hypothetical protein
MKPEVLAQARRYYHHVLHGGTLRPEDVAFMVEALEEAANQRKWVGLSYRDVMGIFEYWDFNRDSSLVEFNKLKLCELFELVEAKLKEKNT